MSSSSSSRSPSQVSRPAVRPRKLGDYAISRRIGGGFGGQVYQARDVVTEREVAIKVIPKSKASVDLVVAEQETQAALDHQTDSPSFLLPLLTSFHDEENFYLVTVRSHVARSFESLILFAKEYLGGLDLASHIGGATRFDEGRVRQLAAELVVTLQQLRDARVIHRDIKPGNILFTPDGHMRLTDFGLSKRFATSDVNTTATEVLGTSGYISAAVHKGDAYSYEVDIHAAGVILYQMATLRLPFGGRAPSPAEMQASVLDGNVTFKKTDRVVPVLQNLLRGMMGQGESQFTLNEMKAHPYFNNVPWKAVARQTMVMDWKPRLARSSGRFTGPPVSCGASYVGRDDPYPRFSYISPSLLVQRTLPGPGQKASRRISALVDTVTRRNVMPPTKSSKASAPLMRTPVVFERIPESSAIKPMVVAPAVASSLRRPASSTAADLLATPKVIPPGKSANPLVSSSPTAISHALDPVAVAWPSPTSSDASTVEAETPAPERCVKPKPSTKPACKSRDSVIKTGHPAPSRTSSRPPLGEKTNKPSRAENARRPAPPSSRGSAPRKSSAKENVPLGRPKANTTTRTVARITHTPRDLLTQNEAKIGEVCDGPHGGHESKPDTGHIKCIEEGPLLLATIPMELDPAEATSEVVEIDSLAASPVKIEASDSVSPLDRMLADISLWADTSDCDALDDVDSFHLMIAPLTLDPLAAICDSVELKPLATLAPTPEKLAITDVGSPLDKMLAQLALSVDLSVSQPEESWCPSVAEAFAIPARSPEETHARKRSSGIRPLMLPALVSARTPDVPPPPPSAPPPFSAPPPPPSLPVAGLRPFILGTHTLTGESRDKRYSSPTSLTAKEDIKTHTSDALARARSEVYERVKDGNFPSARDVSPSVSSRWTTAMHYDGGLPVSASTSDGGLVKSTRRRWIHLKMACGRLRTRMTTKLS
ncbi:hypothetical protein DXG03_001120 [Asterophora parasitica]|uniref:non-specific serine/threonine protein kinase n=1 Tax=Asterophora parasitica TaxID=117018 RepID=A0A9P7GD49_9AGAR|nr:hypothetical protein DXG03_001120 [Asterophora parasitica]